MRQGWLPGFDDRDDECPSLTAADLETSGGQAAADDAGVPPLPGQLALFTRERQLSGQMYEAMASGRFEEARAAREALAACEGPSNETRELGLLDQLGAPRFWARSPGAILREWESIARDTGIGPGVSSLVRIGLFVRLLETHTAGEIAREQPAILGPLVSFLSSGRDSAVPDTEPSALVRDALLDGISPPSGDFSDPALVDLLAENLLPAWLACLGAVRRIWPVPALGAADLDVPLPPLPGDGEDDARGRQFWACLRRAVSCGRDAPVAVEARKRMKQLNPALHALFMRLGARRE